MKLQEWTRRLLSFVVKLVRPVVLIALFALSVAGPFGWVMIGVWIAVAIGFVYYAVFVIIMTLLNGIAFYGRRILAKRRNAGSQNPFNDDRPDVVYLRCFHADAFIPGRLPRLTTAEEDLKVAVRPLGDLIALGRPGESLPTPGAARLYPPHNEWRRTISEWMRMARLVIVRAGHGNSLLWECEEAFTKLSPHQFVILVLDLPADEYQDFAAAIQARLGVVLPAIPRYSIWRGLWNFLNNPNHVKPGFIVFSEGWRVQFVHIRHKLLAPTKFRVLVKPFRKALHPVFAAHGVVRMR